MKAISATEFARRAGEVWDAVKGGTHVLVMHHKRQVCVLVPYREYVALLEQADRLRAGDAVAAGEPEGTGGFG